MISKTQLLTVAKKHGTPVYVYDAQKIEAQCAKLQKNFPGVAFHYAMKANSNPKILEIVRKAGVGVEAVSPGELKLALQSKFAPAQISFTCSNMTERELVDVAKTRVRVHLDSLTQLERWGRLKLGREVSLRLNQGIGAGHHAHVITGGPDSKFGISLKDILSAKKLADRYGLTIVGVQQHIGSNVLEAKTLEKAAKVLLATAQAFPDIAHVDFGGGLGIPYAPGAKQLPLAELGKNLRTLTKALETNVGRKLHFSMEPGRFIVAEAGTLLVSVVDQKSTEKHLFAGVNSGFNHLNRPAMYGSYHPIENLSRTRGPKKLVTVAGNVCESGDIFASKRPMVKPEVGDILAIRLAGAYGFSMASNYNLRKLPKEILVRGSVHKDISFNPYEYSV